MDLVLILKNDVSKSALNQEGGYFRGGGGIYVELNGMKKNRVEWNVWGITDQTENKKNFNPSWYRIKMKRFGA